MAFAEERLDRVVDVILGIDPAGQDALVAAQMFVQDVDEIAAAVGAGDLAVAEHVGDGKQLILEDFDAVAAVGLGGVVTIGKMEQVDVPFIG